MSMAKGRPTLRPSIHQWPTAVKESSLALSCVTFSETLLGSNERA